MGRVNIQGLGVVNIEGDKPNEQELEVFKRMLSVKESGKLVDAPAEEVTESFMTGPKFGRILTEVGLAIGGSIATGGLALPGLALRAGMLARPFLTQLAKSSIGAGVGGGTGAAVAQTFDPKEDVVKEILRASTEGALGEAIGAPVVIKGGQLVSKLLGGTPKQFNSLLEGAEAAEKSLQDKSLRILELKKIIDDPKSSAVAVRQAKEVFEKLGSPKQQQSIIDSAKEIAEGGLTPGVKSSNRTLEIIENIAQKSLIGGGAISRRYEAASNIGNLVAKDVLENFKVIADEEELGELFLESLGNAQGAFNVTKNKMYQRVDDILTASETKTARIIPVENPLRKAFEEIKEIYSEGDIPEILSKTLKKMNSNITNRSGKYTFSELQKLRQQLVENRFDLKGNPTNIRAVDTILEKVEDLFKSKSVPQAAATALKEANDFFRAGQDVFNRGQVTRILKNAVDGSVDGKDAKAIQLVFKAIAGGDNVSATKALFREIDAMTGKNIPQQGRLKALNKLVDPETGKPLLTVKKAEELKQAFRGQYITNALRASESGGQFGKYYDAKIFANNLEKGEQKLKKFLFQGDNAKQLDDLVNTLNFAQGDLSRLTGLPGGIFIQMKQAGAAGSVLQMMSPAAVTGGQLGAAGLAAGFLGAMPAITILAAPAIATKVLLSPKFNNLMFRKPIEAIVKATNMGKDEFLSLSTAEQKRILADDVVQNKINRSMNLIYRQLVGNMFTDGLITKQERDDKLAEINGFEKGANVIEQKSKAQMPLPQNIPQSNFPIINTGTGGGIAPTGGSSAQQALALDTVKPFG